MAMVVCKQCLMAIESHEGYQRKEPLILYNGESERCVCEWCEEEELVEEMVVI